MVGRTSSEEAEQLSHALRTGSDPFLERRRRTLILSLAAIGALAPVAAYQLGAVDHLPDPPGRWFDSDRVDASGEAYLPGMTPDATTGIVSYAVTLVLAGKGGPDRWRTQPWLPLLLAVKVLADAGSAARLTAEQISKHRRLCAWCLGAAAAVAGTVPQVIPEAKAALSRLQDR